jgi:predicted aldo/keto reductase-like oxidoreductase
MDDVSVANLVRDTQEQEFLSDKNTVAGAQFCVQCEQCRADCPADVDIPKLMRSHMYAVQYGNYAQARDTMAAIASGKSLGACESCNSCRATCRNSVHIAMKIEHLRRLTSNRVLQA